MSSTARPNKSGSLNVFHLQQAFKLALSLVLFYWLALSMNWNLPQYGALAIVIVSLGTTGASVSTGMMRVVGTTAGVAVGFLILALFSGDRWGTMIAFSIHLTLMGYFMQTSRYSYAWYAAAFVPMVVWADNYPQFGSTFYFGTFRWLETTTGILVYTVVDLVLWPRQAGAHLLPLGRDFLQLAGEQFSSIRQMRQTGGNPEESSSTASKLDGTLPRISATLQQAYIDTPAIGRQRRAWKDFCLHARGLIDALEICKESISDCRDLDLDRLIPNLPDAMTLLDNRFKHMTVLWDAALSAQDKPDRDDLQLLQPVALEHHSSASGQLSHFQLAALMSLIRQLEILDQVGRELLKTLRALNGFESLEQTEFTASLREVSRPPAWDPERLLKACFPAVTFIAGFFFWIVINPPGGIKLPMFAAILALVVLRTPKMNPFSLWLLLVFSTIFAVAPIYWLVMPALSTGTELLCLIFVYSFFFGYLGGRSPALKSGPIIQFVMSSGINNQQSYSFQGLVTGALLVILAGMTMIIVYYCFRPLRPEQALLINLRRFFKGCARIIDTFTVTQTGLDQDQQRRERYLQAMVLPAPAKLQAAQQQLDYRFLPDHSSERVQQLHDCVQSIANRMRSLDLIHRRIAQHSTEFPESLLPLRQELRTTAQRVFQKWARFEASGAYDLEQPALQQLTRQFEEQLDGLELTAVSDEEIRDLYTMLGVVRGLFGAMANTQIVISQINSAQTFPGQR